MRSGDLTAVESTRQCVQLHCIDMLVKNDEKLYLISSAVGLLDWLAGRTISLA